MGVVPLAGTPGQAYLARRGIPLETAHESGVRWSPRYHKSPAVVFPVRDRTGALVAVQGRRISETARPKAVTEGRKTMGAFATLGALAADPAVIVEGPIDALSLALVGVPAVATLGSDLPEWLAWHCSGRRVLVASDADTVGEAAAARWIAALVSAGAECARLRPDGRDWNEMLCEDGPECLAWYVEQQVAPAWPHREGPPVPALGVGEMTREEFSDSGQWAWVESELLGEVIVVAADNAQELPPKAVIYRAAELARLRGAEPEAVRLVHQVKRVFGGRVLGGDDK